MDEKIFSGDRISKNCKRYTGNEHSSVDGIYYYIPQKKPFTLIFIEFKFFSKKNLEETPEMEDFRKNLRLKLRLKPLETVFCALPHLIENNDKTGNIDIIKEQLINSKKKYFFVTDFEEEKPDQLQNYLNIDYFDLKRLAPHPFYEVKILNPEDFKFLMEAILKCDET